MNPPLSGAAEKGVDAMGTFPIEHAQSNETMFELAGDWMVELSKRVQLLEKQDQPPAPLGKGGVQDVGSDE